MEEDFGDEEEDILPLLNRIGAFIKGEIIRMAPVDMNELRLSVGFRVEGDTVIFTATAPQAEAMEYGSPPEPLDEMEKQDLTAWAHRHKTSGKGMIKYIEKHGIVVGTEKNPLHITSFGRDSYRPFMRPAIYMNMPQVIEMVVNYYSEAG